MSMDIYHNGALSQPALSGAACPNLGTTLRVPATVASQGHILRHILPKTCLKLGILVTPKRCIRNW